MIHVNVCAGGNDWLFADLKSLFLRTAVPGLRVTGTEDPDRSADAWVFIRTGEATDSPDLARSVVCIHDLYDHDGIYLPGGDRHAAGRAGALVLSHPDQRRILMAAGIPVDRIRLLERPLGALSIFTVRTEMPPVFTIGWVGRNHWRKRPEWLVDCARILYREGTSARFVLVGKELDPCAEAIRGIGLECRLYDRRDHPIETYPAFYQQMDCLLVTSVTEAGPLTLFEALATGLPVASTAVGWAPILARRSSTAVLLGENPQELAENLRRIAGSREVRFRARREIAQLASEPRLDTWPGQVLQLAASLIPAARQQRSYAG
ncbi:MAG TPA: glycosyltransferase family 4 protein [Bryobacteraceae bacterium]|jgi:glycosyltransferase involved in cell wall biosynthesis